MKNRMKAVLLATGLSVSLLFSPVLAGEAATEDGSAAVVETLTEAPQEQDGPSEGSSGDGEFAAYYEDMKQSVTTTIANLSTMTDAQLQGYIESDDASNKAIAANWKAVKKELGSFVEVTEQTIEENPEESTILISSKVTYDQVPANTDVTVDYLYNYKKNTVNMSWDIVYPMGKLMTEAALNTLMGLGIVFLVLVFLSFIISRFSLLSGIGEKKPEKQEKAPAPVAAPAVEEEEEELADDGELVAVIAAAIAAYEQTGTEGFVVRSIKKANRKKWQSA